MASWKTVMENTSRAANLSFLVKQTEKAIQQYLQDSSNDYLATVNALEDISYRLWVDSNSAFLEEDVDRSLQDDDSWQWDDECFFDSPNNATTGLKLPVLPESSRRVGYHRSFVCTPSHSSGTPNAKNARSDVVTPRGQEARSQRSKPISAPYDGQGDSDSADDEWVVIGDDAVPNDYDWLVLSQKKCNDAKGSSDGSFTTYIYKSEFRVPSRGKESSPEGHVDDDWVVLSVEIKERLHPGSSCSTHTTPDSGIDSSTKSVCDIEISSGKILHVAITQRHGGVIRRKLDFS